MQTPAKSDVNYSCALRNGCGVSSLTIGSLFLLSQVHASVFSVRWFSAVSTMNRVVKMSLFNAILWCLKRQFHSWLLKLKEAQNGHCFSKLRAECFLS